MARYWTLLGAAMIMEHRSARGNTMATRINNGALNRSNYSVSSSFTRWRYTSLIAAVYTARLK